MAPSTSATTSASEQSPQPIAEARENGSMPAYSELIQEAPKDDTNKRTYTRAEGLPGYPLV